MTIKILLTDDHEIFRQGLKMLLDSQPDFEVVGQAVDGNEALALVERLRPDVVIVDIMMPGLSGIDVASEIKRRMPACRVIVLSMHDDESYVQNALQNGAAGYILKDSSAADLVQAVHAVMAGQRFLSQPLTERAIQAYINQPLSRGGDIYETLTQREREVLRLTADGLSASDIARRLTISPRTVETHRANLMHKLSLHSQVEIAAFARKHKLIP